MYKGKTVAAILLAAGSGARFGAGFNKAFVTLGETPLYTWALRSLCDHPNIDRIFLVMQKKEFSALTDGCCYGYDENSITLVEGGQTRRESVRNALLATDADIVLIQDAARPFLKREYIDGCLDAMDRYPGATVAAPSTDTIKISREDQTVDHTTDRSRTWQTQTPQCFDRQVLLEANARYDGSIEATDDCMLLERTGFPVALIPGSAENIKITRPLDLKLAELLIADGRM